MDAIRSSLRKRESGTDIAVLLLANRYGADHGRVCASCVTDSQPLSLEHRGPSFGSTLSTSLFGPYVASLQSARVLELFHKDSASGAFQPSFRVPPPLVEGLKHLQWSRCARDSDDDYVIDEAHSNYELNALGCALCFGYTLDLLAALMIAGADENSLGCVLNEGVALRDNSLNKTNAKVIWRVPGRL